MIEELSLSWVIRCSIHTDYPELLIILTTALAPLTIWFDYGIELCYVQDSMYYVRIVFWNQSEVQDKYFTLFKLRLAGYLCD